MQKETDAALRNESHSESRESEDTMDSLTRRHAETLQCIRQIKEKADKRGRRLGMRALWLLGTAIGLFAAADAFGSGRTLVGVAYAALGFVALIGGLFAAGKAEDRL